MTAAHVPIHGRASPVNVLVTGASSGIGLALVWRLLDQSGVARVFAVSRTATRSAPLALLQSAGGERLSLHDTDLTDDRALASLASAVAEVDALHLVINAAGVLHDDVVAPEKSIEQVRRAALEHVFALNAFAPLLLAQALLPRMPRRGPVVFASVSARVGSIGDNRAGGWYAYRASKAAQNQLLRTFAIEWKRSNPDAIVLLLHPGTVDTPLSAPFRSRVPADALSDADTAAARLLHIVATATPADSGRFIAWDGRDVQW